MGSTSLFPPCAAAPNAPRIIMPSRCYELKGWHCGHGGNFFWLCSNLGVFAKTMILILFSLKGFLHTVLAKSTTQKCLVWDAVVSFAPAIPLPTVFIRNMLCHANVASGGVLKLCMSDRSLSVCPKPTQKLEDLFWMVCTWTAPTKLLLHEFVHEPPES